MTEAQFAIEPALRDALDHHRAGRLDSAAELYRRILARDPGHADSLHLLGLVAHQSGRHAEAAELIGKALALDDTVPAYHANAGVVLRALDRGGEAEAHLRRALALDPSYAEAQANLASLLQSRGRVEEAVSHYRQALALNPRHAVAHSNLGGALILLGRPEEARAALEQAVALAPDLADAHLNLGLLLGGQGLVEAAIASFRRVLETAPQHAEAWRLLADRLAESGRPEEALAAYQRARALAPADVPTLIGLGTVLLEQGRRDAAAELALQATGLPAAPSVALGILLARCGLEEAARRQLEASRAGGEADGAELALAALESGSAPAQPSDSQVRRFYSGLAEGWDEKMRLDEQYFAPGLAAAAIERLLGAAADLDILDAACGTGLVGSLLRGRARRLEGVDLSPEMLAKARAKGIYDSLAEGDITRFLADRPLRYDIVTCVAALFFSRDLYAVFAAAFAALRENGLFVLTLFPNDQESEAEPVRLQLNGTYRHGRAYVARTAAAVGFDLALIEEHVHEIVRGAPAKGLLVALRKPA